VKSRRPKLPVVEHVERETDEIVEEKYDKDQTAQRFRQNNRLKRTAGIG
jgi:hypothetical protein